MLSGKAKLARERKTVRLMLELYCKDHHSAGKNLCGSCKALLDYADLRLDKCPFGGDKPTCANCKIHCYKPEMRERVREVMRYSGPRLMKKHPLLSIMHLLDGLRKPPKKAPRKKKN